LPLFNPRKILERSAALIAGALVPLSLAPYNILFLSFLSLTAFAWLILRAQSKKELFITAMCFGTGLFAVGVSWVYVSIHVYGEATPILAALMTMIFVLFLAALFALPWILLEFTPRRAIDQALCFAAIWLLAEWIRGWILTGFPWLYVGQGHLVSPLSGWLPILGSLGVGFLHALLCATLALAINNGIQKVKITIPTMVAYGLVLAILILSPLLSRLEWTTGLDPIEVSLIQPNIPLEDKWDADLRDANLQILLDLSEGSWNSDILVWPEAALPLATLSSTASAQTLQEVSSFLGPETSLVTGRLVYDSIYRRFHNNVIGLGQGEGEYTKRRLVPFGEYVPLEGLLRGLIEFFDLPMSVITAGDPDQEHLKAGELSVAIALCYEIAYGNQVALDSRNANLLVTVSNDTWFGESIGPHQHFQIAQIRARETSKPVLRGTNNGVTGVIDARGQIVASSEQFVATALTSQLTPHSGSTPFARWGESPLVALLIFVFIFSLGRRSS